MKIDAHQHFWHYNPQEYSWIGPGMERLKKDHLPANLAPLLEATGIEGTVAVQARQTLVETEWLLKLADQASFIKGVVGWVDLFSPELPQQLARFQDHPKFRGIRHVVQDEPDDQFILRKGFIHGLEILAEFNLTYDLLIFSRHLPVACDLVEKFPEQRFVLDHIAKPHIKIQNVSPWETDIRRLAAFPNVFCKVSGMVTEADWQHWQADDFRPYLDIVFAAFGPDRLMFGSDWPVCTVAGTYARVVKLVSDYVRQMSDREQAAIWGETAKKFYDLI